MLGTSGFTLIELLIILLIVSIVVLAFSYFSVRSLRAAELREGAFQLANDFKTARSRAQRTSQDTLLSWTTDSTGRVTNYQIGNVTKQLPKGIYFICKSNCNTSQIGYKAPFGELSSGAAGHILQVYSPMSGLTPLDLRLVGVTGKVILAKSVGAP